MTFISHTSNLQNEWFRNFFYSLPILNGCLFRFFFYVIQPIPSFWCIKSKCHSPFFTFQQFKCKSESCTSPFPPLDKYSKRFTVIIRKAYTIHAEEKKIEVDLSNWMWAVFKGFSFVTDPTQSLPSSSSYSPSTFFYQVHWLNDIPDTQTLTKPTHFITTNHELNMYALRYTHIYHFAFHMSHSSHNMHNKWQ